MFHLKSKPSPPVCTGRLTPGHEVDSSAAVMSAGTFLGDDRAQFLEELDRFDVLATSEGVRDPFAFLA